MSPIREAAEAKAVAIVNAPMCNPCTCRTNTTIECGQLRDAITNALLAARVEGMREAEAMARKRSEGYHSEECESGHVEYDTGAFVCSNRSGCLCQEREEEAEAIADVLRARADELDAIAKEIKP